MHLLLSVSQWLCNTITDQFLYILQYTCTSKVLIHMVLIYKTIQVILLGAGKKALHRI